MSCLINLLWAQNVIYVLSNLTSFYSEVVAYKQLN